MRFLLVDDNVHMLNIVKTILRGFGAVHVFEAKEPGEAFHRLRNDAVDIVILDYLMGEEDGVAFLRKLRRDADSPSPYAPVIMLTAHSERARVEAARDAGVTEFCTKPVTAADMLRKVAAVIDHPRHFVRSDDYFGPDRRRHGDPNYKGEERRNQGGDTNAADDGAATRR
ncbi:MAG TPA: response regulator [Caulobacteraceae bacterium]|nr:response regulator [Caulobacteraceae bacterium]